MVCFPLIPRICRSNISRSIRIGLMKRGSCQIVDQTVPREIVHFRTQRHPRRELQKPPGIRLEAQSFRPVFSETLPGQNHAPIITYGPPNMFVFVALKFPHPFYKLEAQSIHLALYLAEKILPLENIFYQRRGATSQRTMRSSHRK